MKPKQIWLQNTKKFQLVRFVLFEKMIKYESLIIGDNIFYLNGVTILVYIDDVLCPDYKNLPVEFNPKSRMIINKVKHEGDCFWTLDFILIWNFNFESTRTDSTILNLIHKRINYYKAYNDSLNNKQILKSKR